MLYGGSVQMVACFSPRAAAAAGLSQPRHGWPLGGGFFFASLFPERPADLPSWLSEAEIDSTPASSKLLLPRSPHYYRNNIDPLGETAAFSVVACTVPRSMSGDRGHGGSRFPARPPGFANSNTSVPALRNIQFSPLLPRTRSSVPTKYSAILEFSAAAELNCAARGVLRRPLIYVGGIRGSTRGLGSANRCTGPAASLALP